MSSSQQTAKQEHSAQEISYNWYQATNEASSDLYSNIKEWCLFIHLQITIITLGHVALVNF